MSTAASRCRDASRLAALALLFFGGCAHAPAVSVVTQHTALESQAAGEYPSRERELSDASLSPGPEPIPREQLADQGEAMTLGVVEELVTAIAADEGRIDSLLVSRCIGEATSGLLEMTTATCTQDVDANEVARLVERVNVHRRQIWAFLAEGVPGTSEREARGEWRATHEERIVCGAQIERDDGRWETKTCEERAP